jgi:hypothetical protein
MKPGNILEGSRTPLSANDREVCARRAITVLWELHEYTLAATERGHASSSG